MTTELHRLVRHLHFILTKASQTQGKEFAIIVALLLIALVFLIVGISRIVEFQGIGLSAKQRRTMSSVHITGCIFLTTALGLYAIDTARIETALETEILAIALILLLPIQIYLFKLRRSTRRR